MHLTLEELITYTDEERDKWERWFAVNGDGLLAIPLAGDECPNIGALVTHVFQAEALYAELLRCGQFGEGGELWGKNQPPAGLAQEVFAFGRLTRAAMRAFADGAGPGDWARLYEFRVCGRQTRVTARKIVGHTLVHEVRHWAQVATLVRQAGHAPPGEHDLIFSRAAE